MPPLTARHQRGLNREARLQRVLLGRYFGTMRQSVMQTIQVGDDCRCFGFQQNQRLKYAPDNNLRISIVGRVVKLASYGPHGSMRKLAIKAIHLVVNLLPSDFLCHITCTNRCRVDLATRFVPSDGLLKVSPKFLEGSISFRAFRKHSDFLFPFRASLPTQQIRLIRDGGTSNQRFQGWANQEL